MFLFAILIIPSFRPLFGEDHKMLIKQDSHQYIPHLKLDNKKALENWLTQSSETHPIFLVPLNLSVDFTQLNPIQSSWISTKQKEKVEVYLDSTALGIPLMDQIRALCKEPLCEIWVKAQKGPLIINTPDAKKGPILSILKVYSAEHRLEWSREIIFEIINRNDKKG